MPRLASITSQALVGLGVTRGPLVWTLAYTLDNPNAYGTTDNDYFGGAVSISGNRAIVAAAWEDDINGDQSGKVYIFDVTTGSLLQTLDNPNAYGTSAIDFFGYSVAIDGDYAIVGAIGEDDDGAVDGDTGSASGKAYIFDVTTGNLVHTLDNPNAYGSSAGDQFGTSVAISGNYAIVGAPQEDDLVAGTTSGKAYIYNVTTGALVHTLDDPNPETTKAGNDWFGFWVAIDGNYAIISAYGEDDAGSVLNDGTWSGKAYIYNVTTGSLIYTIDNPTAYGANTDDYFSRGGVSIRGNYAIVGHPYEDDEVGNGSGKAFIYSTTIGDWSDTTLVHTLDNPNAYGGIAGDTFYPGDRFGRGVSIDGDYAIVGANNEDDPSGSASGKAYIFDVTTGSLLQTLDNPNPDGINALGNSDIFGTNIAISGNRAIVSAHQEDEDGNNSGKAYVYKLSYQAPTTSSIGLLYTLDNPNPIAPSTFDYFGGDSAGVAVSNSYIVVAASREDTASDFGVGRAYVFNSTGTLLHTLDNPNVNPKSFGRSLAADGNFTIVGATDTSNGATFGNAYIFNMSTGTLVATIDNPGPIASREDDRFGWAVGISGNYAIVSAVGEADDGGIGDNSGKAYIFSTTTGDWDDTTLVHTLDNPNAYDDGFPGDRFGSAVAIRGNYAIVGAEYEDTADELVVGKAYIFNVTTGALLHTLDNPDVVNSAFFGSIVDLDDTHAIVGRPTNGNDAGGGKAYIFKLSNGSLVHTLDNPNTFGSPQTDFFGAAVSISGDYAIVGSYNEDDADNGNTGKAYIFSTVSGELLHTLDNPNAYDTPAGDGFGKSVALRGNRVIVGAYGEDDADGTISGKVYVYEITES